MAHHQGEFFRNTTVRVDGKLMRAARSINAKSFSQALVVSTPAAVPLMLASFRSTVVRFKHFQVHGRHVPYVVNCG